MNFGFCNLFNTYYHSGTSLPLKQLKLTLKWSLDSAYDLGWGKIELYLIASLHSFVIDGSGSVLRLSEIFRRIHETTKQICSIALVLCTDLIVREIKTMGNG